MAIPVRVRALLRERAGGRCERCGKPANNAHHRRGKGQGGPDVVSNLLLLCGSGNTGCHGWITEHPHEAYLHGWSIRGTQVQPWDKPVELRHGLVLLDNEGNYRKTAA